MKINRLLERAIEENVSDIHLNYEVNRSEIVGRRHKKLCYRYDDQDVLKIHAYCKRKSNFDMSRFGPQTGIFTWIVDDFEYLIRFSSMESLRHKNAVLRILNLHQQNAIEFSIPEKETREKVLDILCEPSGIVLYVGKTGSGKSTTMFNCLSSFEDSQIYSVENPIERHHPKWIQIETNNFEEALTQLLRHDPDIVVFGEVRSEDDIRQLIRAGLSGHRVVSTMHAGSVYQSIRRLCDLGASIYDLQDILRGVIFQSLRVREGGVEIEYIIWNHKEIKAILYEIEAE